MRSSKLRVVIVLCLAGLGTYTLYRAEKRDASALRSRAYLWGGDGGLLARSMRGLLRVTASTSCGQAVLAEAIAEFSERHPQLRVDLQLGDRTVNLIEERIDLAIRITNEPDPGLVGRRRCGCRSLVVASPAYLARHGVPSHPLELEQHRCLSYSNFGRSEWRFQQGAEEALRVRVSGRISANEASALLSAAQAGAGVSLQPSYLAAPFVRRGELVALLPGWEPEVLGIHALYPSRRLLPLALRGLLDFLAERFDGPQAPWDRLP